MEFRGLILAAGRGKRFAGEMVAGGEGGGFPKVLRPALGRPLIGYVIDGMRSAGVQDITIIVGYGAKHVREALGPGFRYVVQTEQKGSGHAVLCAKETMEPLGGQLVIMCGDSPLFTAGTIRRLMTEHSRTDAVVTLALAGLADPSGYGRVVRDEAGRIIRIVEDKSASPEEKRITEINGGLYALDASWLWKNIDRMQWNEAGELNLTDMVRIAIGDGAVVSSVGCEPEEVLGVNTPEQLLEVEAILRRRSAFPIT